MGCGSWRVTRGNPLCYLKIFLDYCYYVGIIPFYFSYDEECGCYKIESNRVQKSFCVIITVLCICEEILSFRSSVDFILDPPNGNRSDPLIYFEMFTVASNIIYYTTVFRTIWWKSEKFLILIQHLHDQEKNSIRLRGVTRRNNIKAKIWFAASLIPFVAYPVTIISGFFLREPTFDWNRRILYWGENASKLFFVENYFNDFPHWIKVILAIMRNMFLLSYTQITTSMEMLDITSAMMMCDVIQDFSETVKKAKEYSNEELLAEYQLIRTLSRKLNKALGFLTFGLTLACLPYYIANLLEFINPANVAIFFRHLVFFINSFGFLLLAAQINKKTHLLEERLLTEKDFSDISQNTLSIFLHDLSSHNIGFNGSGFFIVSPGFVGTIISLLLTFSIIIIQFQNSNFPIPAVTIS